MLTQHAKVHPVSLCPSHSVIAQPLPAAALHEASNVSQAQIVDAGGDLAGMVVGKVLLGILHSHCGQQERPALLPNGLMVVGPVGWSGLQDRTNTPQQMF